MVINIGLMVVIISCIIQTSIHVSYDYTLMVKEHKENIRVIISVSKSLTLYS